MERFQIKQVITMLDISHNNKVIYFVLLFLFFSQSAYSMCLGWSSLYGYQIIEANTLRKLDCPISGNYDCLQWPQNFYEWGSKCVQLNGYYGYGDEAILMSNGTTNQMVTFGLMNSPDCHTVKFYNCPSLY